MAIRFKPKTYGPVFASRTAEGALCYGRDIDQISETAPVSGSPAETLLSSIAACMVLSIEIVADHDKTALNPFKVSVSATKSEDPPSHFGSYVIRVTPNLTNDPAQAADIVKRAKIACTISNSVNGEIALSSDLA